MLNMTQIPFLFLSNLSSKIIYIIIIFIGGLFLININGCNSKKAFDEKEALSMALDSILLLGGCLHPPIFPTESVVVFLN